MYYVKIKLYKQNKTFPNSKRKFYERVGAECIKTNQQPEAKETKQF